MNDQATARLTELKAKREAAVKDYEKLQAQLNQLVAGINQLDGGIAVLEEIVNPHSIEPPPIEN